MLGASVGLWRWFRNAAARSSCTPRGPAAPLVPEAVAGCGCAGEGEGACAADEAFVKACGCAVPVEAPSREPLVDQAPGSGCGAGGAANAELAKLP
mmetsp:Transcript_15431/g.44185  ORF Transcript_15431/g.44185 Transcript_15431/m.44185 type:complete len:96 (-) Transcript_15431:253-540(-)